MPPNKKGGKNYKKGKHATDAPIVYERLEGQMYARVIKVLGNCNLLVYCNDGRERICHIRGNMRKKVWMGTGDIVLISVRDFGNEKAGELGKGDICAKYDQSVLSKLKHRDPDINPKLFLNIETNTEIKGIDIQDGDGFEFEGGDSEEDEDESDEEEHKHKFPSNRLAQRKAAADDDDSLNIDDI